MLHTIKKHLITNSLFAILICLIASCSEVKKLPAKVAGASRAKFVGTWTITRINYEGLLAGAVQAVFNQGSPEDFNGSTWNLTNSGNGSYTLTNGTSQSIFWSYSNSNGQVFQFKQLYPGDKARKVEEGYQLSVADINSSQMTLKLPVSTNGRTAYVVYTFNRTK